MSILQDFVDGKGRESLSREEVSCGLFWWEWAVSDHMSGVTAVDIAMMELAGRLLAELSSPSWWGEWSCCSSDSFPVLSVLLRSPAWCSMSRTNHRSFILSQTSSFCSPCGQSSTKNS